MAGGQNVSDELRSIKDQNFVLNILEGIGLGLAAETAQVIEDLIYFLNWADSIDDRCAFDVLYQREATYYFVAGTIESQSLIEYGVSIRHPWLTDKGKTLLLTLKTRTSEQWETDLEALAEKRLNA